MSHNQHKKRYLNESGNSSTDSSSRTGCGCGDKGCNQCRACIICPPCDYRETYETESSDHSCPDFSDLCDDESRHCLKNDHKRHEEKDNSDEYSDSDSESEPDHDKKKKKGCGCKGNGGCCQPCNRCENDHSRNSVANSLGSDTDGSCPDFSDLVCDQKRECIKVKKEHHEKSEESDSSEDKPHKKPHKKDSSTSSTSSSTPSSSGRGKKFVVSYGSKEGHPWSEYNTEDSSIHINGKNGPVLHLYRDRTYFFCVEQKNYNPDNRFVLTNKPDGGKGSKIITGGFEPVSKGCVSLKVDKFTPRYFFYQDANNSFKGGLVIVHDE